MHRPESSVSIDVGTESSDTFARLLKDYRRSKVTQAQLQISLENIGYPIDTTTLSKYESGERWPPASFIPYFVKALDLSEWDENALLTAYLTELRVAAIEEYLRGKSNVQ